MSIHQYLATTGNLAGNLTVSEGRIKVTSIHVSNANQTSAAIIWVEDKDNNELFQIVVPPVDSKLISYAEPVDFENGLVFRGIGVDGDLVTVQVARSRNL
jgi:hypothetical protein